MEIDHDLLERIAAKPTATVQVVLSCGAAAGVDDRDLARHGFTVEERQKLEDLLLIHGKIKLGELRRLAEIPGIDTVSSAPEAEIYNTHSELGNA